MVKNSLTEKKTSPNETVHRKKHFKHIFGGRGRWEIRKKGENFKNNLRLEKKRMILIKRKECIVYFKLRSSVITNYVTFIANCVRYFKLRPVDWYYKLRQVLQITSFITNYVVTHSVTIFRQVRCRRGELSEKWDVEQVRCRTSDNFRQFSEKWDVGEVSCRTSATHPSHQTHETNLCSFHGSVI